MRPMRIALLAISFAVSPVALAAGAPFAGTWATSPEQCGKDQSAEGAPLILTETSYNQGEAHCTLDPATEDSGAWKAKAKCSVEGDSQDGTFTFAVNGDTLTVRDDSGERKLQRCAQTGNGAAGGGAADKGAADTGAPDKGVTDTGAADKATPDAASPDKGAADTGAADKSAPDAGAPDTGAADTGAADKGAGAN